MAVDVDAPERQLSARWELSEDDSSHGDDEFTASRRERLRDAMDRLLAGRPQRTDGTLIKDNLWKEAGLSRATMNRAARILAE
jgi:hypothetical protein